MAVIMDGKALSARIREELRLECASFSAKYGRMPGLAVVLVGDDPASLVYVRNKKKACAEIGYLSREILLPQTVTEAELLTVIDGLNHDSLIDGILVQLPLPVGIDESRVLRSISPDKDVDAFHPENVGNIMLGKYSVLPCTPAGVMALIREYGIEPAGRKCVVVGRSNIVGKPMAMLLLEANGTVTVCHSKTRDLWAECRTADILVVAIGKARYITADMVKPGAVVIDVGMNRDGDGRLCGDVDFSQVAAVASYITPVPGGVGPMTIAMLMKNTMTAALIHAERGGGD